MNLPAPQVRGPGQLAGGASTHAPLRVEPFHPGRRLLAVPVRPHLHPECGRRSGAAGGTVALPGAADPVRIASGAVMTDIGASSSATNTYSTAPRSTGWTGWIVFAAFMMFLNGVIGAMEGLVALVNDDYFPVSSSGLALSVNYTVWGFVHLVVGVAVFAAGIGVLSGNVAARAVGVVLAGVNALVAMVFIQAAPGWGFLVITVDLLVIYALTIHGGELRDPR
jgi:hypothetical protein